ncbi:MAG: hypothetical protein ACJ8LN_14265 [Sulfurifustis sp.]
MDRRVELGKLVLVSMGSAAFFLSLCPPAGASDFYVGAGSAIIHSHGYAYQIAAPVYHNIEAHYSGWKDGEHDQALGIGYRFDNGSPVSVVLGIAYVGTVTDNLIRHADAYIEVRVGPFFNHFSCQISHYSTIGDDRGANMLLCGLQWH